MGDEDPHADPDFAHLSPRDAEIAVFIDHLEDGHAMGYKVLAAEHPRYGQQAFRTSLRCITAAGHLRWIKEHLTVEDNSMRWVTRTYWSRTPRSPEWWANFARERDGRDVTQDYRPGLARVGEEVPVSAPQPTPEAEADAPEPEQPSVAYRTLAELRDADPRMPLSETECHSLESLAADWLSRGATTEDVTRALTDGLPPAVTNPGGLARRRLETKMPPKKAKLRQKAPARARVSRVIMACGTCDEDERTMEIVDGLCRRCWTEFNLDDTREQAPIPETFLPGPRGGGLPGAEEVVDVTARVDALRRAAGLAPRAGRRR